MVEYVGLGNDGVRKKAPIHPKPSSKVLCVEAPDKAEIQLVAAASDDDMQVNLEEFFSDANELDDILAQDHVMDENSIAELFKGGGKGLRYNEDKKREAEETSMKVSFHCKFVFVK